MADVPANLVAALAGRYRLERQLGHGGMATVNLAHDLKHDRDVALKVLRPEIGVALGAERFLSEIRPTAQLRHPHILPLRDFAAPAVDVVGPMPYLALQTMFDAGAPKGLLAFWKTEYLKELPAAAIDIMIEHAGRMSWH